MLPSILFQQVGIFPRIKSKSKDISITNQIHDQNDVSRLYDRMRRGIDLIHIEQDQEYRHWLMAESKRTYLSYFAYSKNRLTSYAYVDASNPTTAMLVDFGSENVGSLSVILRKAKADLAQRGTVFLHTSYNVRNPFLRKLSYCLYAHGFVPFYRKGGFVIRPISHKQNNIMNNIASWYITPMWSLLH